MHTVREREFGSPHRERARPARNCPCRARTGIFAEILHQIGKGTDGGLINASSASRLAGLLSKAESKWTSGSFQAELFRRTFAERSALPLFSRCSAAWLFLREKSLPELAAPNRKKGVHGPRPNRLGVQKISVKTAHEDFRFELSARFMAPFLADSIWRPLLLGHRIRRFSRVARLFGAPSSS